MSLQHLMNKVDKEVAGVGYNPFYNIENPQLMGYEYAWVDFMKNGKINQTIIPTVISDSWEECRKMEGTFQIGTAKKANDAKMHDPVIELLINEGGKIVQNIFKNLDDDLYGIITDTQGRKLFGLGTKKDERLDRMKDIGEISCFSERDIGTNCFSIVSKLQKAYSVAGAQHYLESLHKYAGYAAPIFNGDSEMIGMVGFYTLAERMDDYILSFAVSVELAIENSLSWLKSREVVKKQREEKQYILDTVSDGVMYVDSTGTIIHGNRKLFELFDTRNHNFVGKNISYLNTAPCVEELKKYPYSSMYSTCDNKISIINSRGESRKSFLNKYKFHSDEDQDTSEIWVFSVYSDIKKLAQKLSNGNTSRFTFDDIKGSSKAMKDVIEMAKKASTFEAGTIIEGESGTGKEMLAQAIHSYGPRKNGPFIAVDCGALPSTLLESELFGYEEGAFTGAKRGGKKGKFELANRGILFLDEITNMPYDVQAKLLRVLQERKIVPVGGTEPVSLDVQVIAATNKDIVKEMESGTFRRDLFYRLNLLHIKLPTLLERENDFKLFLKYFLNKFDPRGDMRLSKEAVDILSAYDWPGNVRQLENVIERMTIITNSKIIGKECIPSEIVESVSLTKNIHLVDGEEDWTLKELCAYHVKKTAEKYGGNVQRTAKALGLSRATVYKYLEQTQMRE